MSYKIAVVGATGAVGLEILSILSERNFPASEVIPLASINSKDKEVSYGEQQILKTQVLDGFDFNGVDIALFSPGAAISAIHAPRAAESKCIVIDNTSQFRMDEDIPLVIPEVNAEEIKNYTNKYIISNPNCSTIQMLVALAPLHKEATIKRIVVSTYQSASGAGRKAMDELYNNTKSIFINTAKSPEIFPKQIAFNIIPHIDKYTESGYTKEEEKMVKETQKILSPSIEVTATCVRVPVFRGHGESVNIEFENPITENDVRMILNRSRGVTVHDDMEKNQYITPKDCVKCDDVFVSRIRKDPTVAHGINMWIVSDNIRKGSALNAVQIAEELVNDYI